MLNVFVPSRHLFRASAMVGSVGLSAAGAAAEKRGALIVLEGLDRSGKSSQCSQLVSFLSKQGVPVEGWRFPDRSTAIGSMISSYLSTSSDLDDSTVHLLFSANRWEKRSLMEAKLKGGTTLVVDRYSYSGVAFSAAKGLDLNWCKAPEIGLLAPDLVLYLNIPAEIAAERGGYGGERYEKIEFQMEVYKQYRLLQDPTWQVVDATKSMDQVQEIIRDSSMKAIAKCKEGQELQHLWVKET